MSKYKQILFELYLHHSFFQKRITLNLNTQFHSMKSQLESKLKQTFYRWSQKKNFIRKIQKTHSYITWKHFYKVTHQNQISDLNKSECNSSNSNNFISKKVPGKRNRNLDFEVIFTTVDYFHFFLYYEKAFKKNLLPRNYNLFKT